jgi:MtN3 and saliva related transmembrane protein
MRAGAVLRLSFRPQDIPVSLDASILNISSLGIGSLGIELIGSLAAAITTLCWVPQATKVIRTRDTRSLSLLMYLMLATGIGLWLVYGVLIVSWPLILANAVTFVLVVIILGMKLRFG